MFTDAVTALFGALWTYSSAVGGDSFVDISRRGTTIARKRNMSARNFLKGPWDWLLFLDSDMKPQPDMIQRLVARNLDVVSGLCFLRGAPYSIIGRHEDGHAIRAVDPAQPLVPASWLGTGCLLIRRRVIETLADPWFEANGEDVGEDVNFTRKAREAGFPLWIDTTVEVGHLGIQSVDTQFLTTAWYRTREMGPGTEASS